MAAESRRDGPAEDGPPGLVLAVDRLRREVATLRARLAQRPLVELATGVLAGRLGCPPAEAAAQLADLARDAGVPIRELAGEIVGEAATSERPAPAARQSAAWPQAEPTGEIADVARALLRQLGGPLGTTAVVVWTPGPGGVLVLSGQAGLSAGTAAAWRRVPPGVDTAARRVVDGGGELWPDEVEPTVAGVAGRQAPYRAALPIRRAGVLLGVLELAWAVRPERLPIAVRHQIRAAAELCALALAGAAPDEPDEPPEPLLDVVLHPAVVLEAVPDRDEAIADFRIRQIGAHVVDGDQRSASELEGASLLETYPAVGVGGLFDRLVRTCSTGEPIHDERFHLVLGTGETPPLTVRLSAARTGGKVLAVWRPEDPEARRSALGEAVQRLARLGGFEEGPATGEIVWTDGLYELYDLPSGVTPVPLAALPAHAHPDDAPVVRRVVHSVLRRHRPASAVFRLVRPNGLARYVRIVVEPVTDRSGQVTAVRGAYQDVSAQHWTEIALGATRERLADSEHEAAERQRLALRLQQAILPPEPPPLDAAGLRAAVRYRPAAEQDRVGGDWYDALMLPDGSALLTVGDIAGHGVEAATGMVALRNALRGLAVTGAGPGRLLGLLNTVADRLPEPITATAVCARYDAAARELRWARAGHPPPVLVRAGAPVPLRPPHGVLLGALDGLEYEEVAVRLEPGDVLLLYTDGLIERRDATVEESLAELLGEAGAPGDDLEEYLDRLLELSPADTDDDTCLIAVRAE